MQLPDRELASGISEIIKYGLIRDADLFTWLEANMDALLARDPAATTYAIERSCVNKAEVVAQDEREGGVRATLNLGHTFGHAIETATGYGSWLHGEAVAAGMAMAADMSVRLGWIDGSIRDRCAALSGVGVRGWLGFYSAASVQCSGGACQLLSGAFQLLPTSNSTRIL